MKTTYLKGYRLCVDSFGPMGIWSLQHPIKEAEDAYMLKVGDYSPKLKKDKDLINELDRLARVSDMWFDVRITCKIQYAPLGIPIEDLITGEDDYKLIHSMKILKIEIENDKEAGQP